MSLFKKQKRLTSPTWTVLFEDASSFRSIVDAVCSIMQRVIFKVKLEDSAYYLMVDGSDQATTCFLSARLKLDNVKVNDENGNEFTFCVDCKHVKEAIDTSTSSHLAVLIEGFESESKVKFTLKDPDTHSCQDSSIINTFMETEPPEKLENLDFKTILHIDLPKFKEIIKKARKSRAESVRIQVYLHSSGSTERSLVIYSSMGDQYHEQMVCRETSKDQHGNRVISSVSDDTSSVFEQQKDAVFDNVFPIDNMDAFVKNVHCRQLMARIQKGMPLMIEHQLSGEDTSSHIWFLVAPLHDDEEE